MENWRWRAGAVGEAWRLLGAQFPGAHETTSSDVKHFHDFWRARVPRSETLLFPPNTERLVKKFNIQERETIVITFVYRNIVC